MKYYCSDSQPADYFTLADALEAAYKACSLYGIDHCRVYSYTEGDEHDSTKHNYLCEVRIGEEF